MPSDAIGAFDLFYLRLISFYYLILFLFMNQHNPLFCSSLENISEWIHLWIWKGTLETFIWYMKEEAEETALVQEMS